MADAQRHPAWDQIEPASISPNFQPNIVSYPGAAQVELSKAISLKRIADALASLAAAWGNGEPRSPAICPHELPIMDCPECQAF